jgi:hypothetical protein
MELPLAPSLTSLSAGGGAKPAPAVLLSWKAGSQSAYPLSASAR